MICAASNSARAGQHPGERLPAEIPPQAPQCGKGSLALAVEVVEANQKRSRRGPLFQTAADPGKLVSRTGLVRAIVAGSQPGERLVHGRAQREERSCMGERVGCPGHE